MAIPQLKAFDCAEHDPIEKWVPESDSDVHYSLCLHIGPPDEEGGDLFYVNVATPQAIRDRNLGRDFVRKGIVVNPYSWKNVLEAVDEILAHCGEDGWNQQAESPGKHFHWEFEDYR